MIQFARESLTDDLWAEAMPLLEAHWREVAHFQDIPLNVDRAVYDASDAAGAVRVFTARETSTVIDRVPFRSIADSANGKPPEHSRTLRRPGDLVGYALFFVRPHPHYAGSLQAAQDVIYLDPSCRGGNGIRFMRFCEEQLAAEGVQVVSQHLKIAHGHTRTMEILGYEPMDLIWVKRLDFERQATEVVDAVERIVVKRETREFKAKVSAL